MFKSAAFFSAVVISCIDLVGVSAAVNMPIPKLTSTSASSSQRLNSNTELIARRRRRSAPQVAPNYSVNRYYCVTIRSSCSAQQFALEQRYLQKNNRDVNRWINNAFK
jgi:hypothetical protein